MAFRTGSMFRAALVLKSSSSAVTSWLTLRKACAVGASSLLPGKAKTGIRGLASVAGEENITQTSTDFLNAQRNALKREISALELKREEQMVSSADSSDIKKLDLKIRRLKMELEFSDPKVHRRYLHQAKKASGQVKSDAFSELQYLDWQKKDLPLLDRLATQYKVFGDFFPERVPAPLHTAQLQLNFINTRWSGAYGHPVPPNWSLVSPEVVITTGKALEDVEGRGFYSLVVCDMDRPNPSENAYAEWCHWMIVDIPVEKRIKIAGGSSPFFNEKIVDPALQDGTKNTSFHPNLSTSKDMAHPGKTIFPWVPFHPNLSNPKRDHRYVFSILRHDSPLAETLDVADTGKERVDEEARFKVMRSPFFSNRDPANMVTFGFLRSSWNIYTPNIYAGLAMHEPIYGIAPASEGAAQQWARQARQAVQVAKTVMSEHKTVTGLSGEEVKALNKGQFVQSQTQFRLPELGDLKVDQMKAMSSKGKGSVKAVASVGAQPEHKLPRLTVLGAVAASKAIVNPSQRSRS